MDEKELDKKLRENVEPGTESWLLMKLKLRQISFLLNAE